MLANISNNFIETYSTNFAFKMYYFGVPAASRGIVARLRHTTGWSERALSGPTHLTSVTCLFSCDEVAILSPPNDVTFKHVLFLQNNPSRIFRALKLWVS